ncbi:MAG: multidrug effflux MFS transporter [Chloroflexota bacterium]
MVSHSSRQRTEPAYVEFVIIVSLMMSLTALSIDSMLPALSQIGTDLGVQNPNQRQLIVSVLFLGLSIGQLFFGPLSDKTGRKPAIYSGYALFIAGALISVFATSFPIMLTGRLLQGLGIAAPRAVTLALVRDRYEGRAMAQVMSFVMTVFILIPMIAPSLGQAILQFAGWRSIFVFLILMALANLTWFAVRMPETLAEDRRAPFSLTRIVAATREIIGIRSALGYTLSAGLVSGAFIGYINSAQQILQEQYELGDQFPIYFGVIALSLGLASFLNARLVMRFGMRFLVRWSLVIIFTLACVGLSVAILTSGQPPLWFLISYLMLTFFCIGILFGNQNSLAMKPLGHLAGIGAAVVGSLSTLISMSLGTIIGQSYNGTVLPAIAGMGILALVSIFVVRWAESGK